MNCNACGLSRSKWRNHEVTLPAKGKSFSLQLDRAVYKEVIAANSVRDRPGYVRGVEMFNDLAPPTYFHCPGPMKSLSLINQL